MGVQPRKGLRSGARPDETQADSASLPDADQRGPRGRGRRQNLAPLGERQWAVLVS